MSVETVYMLPDVDIIILTVSDQATPAQRENVCIRAYFKHLLAHGYKTTDAYALTAVRFSKAEATVVEIVAQRR